MQKCIDIAASIWFKLLKMNSYCDWRVYALNARIAIGTFFVAYLLPGCAALSTQEEENFSEATTAPLVLVKPISAALAPWVLQSVFSSSPSEAGPSSVGNEWRHHLLPGKRPTHYTYDATQPVPSVRADAHASASLIRRPLNIAPDQLGTLTFSWRQDALIPGADLERKDKADAALRIILAFDGDSGRLSGRHGMVSELIRMVTGEPLPYATLMYVWCNACPAESILVNPRTDRIKKIAVQSGPEQLHRWLSYQRDIRADFIRAFGEPPGRLKAIGLMTDADNTEERTRVWYGPVRLAAPH
jgi:hypothetical protein